MVCYPILIVASAWYVVLFVYSSRLLLWYKEKQRRENGSPLCRKQVLWTVITPMFSLVLFRYVHWNHFCNYTTNTRLTFTIKRQTGYCYLKFKSRILYCLWVILLSFVNKWLLSCFFLICGLKEVENCQDRKLQEFVQVVSEDN